MEINDQLLKRIGEALSSQPVATRTDLLQNYDMQLTVSPDYMAYSNPRVTTAVDALSTTEVTHLKSTPLPKEGVVICQAAEATEPGAIPFVRGDSRRTGSFHFRVALNPFNITWPEDRKLKLDVTPASVPTDDGRTRPVLVIRVKQPKSAKTVLRPRKKKEEQSK